MSRLFDSPSWILSSLMIMLPAMLLCLLLLWLIRRKISHHVLQKNHDVAGFTFSIIGVLYSVILGFTVVNVQEHYNAAAQTVHVEATTLADLYRDAGVFSNTDRERIRGSLKQYAEFVLHEEWNSTEKSKGLSKASRKILEDVWQSYYEVSLQDEKSKIWYEESISKLDNLMNARLDREFSAREHLGGMMWTILISGALITVGFMFFFGLENMRAQMLMTALLSGYLSFMLYLVYALDHVFKGPRSIKPTDLEQILVLFQQWG